MAKSEAPEPGTPEYQQWLIEHSRPLIDRLFEHPIPEDVAQAEDGLIAGPESWDQLMPEKTIPEDIAVDKFMAVCFLLCTGYLLSGAIRQ